MPCYKGPVPSEYNMDSDTSMVSYMLLLKQIFLWVTFGDYFLHADFLY